MLAVRPTLGGAGSFLEEPLVCDFDTLSDYLLSQSPLKKLSWYELELSNHSSNREPQELMHFPVMVLTDGNCISWMKLLVSSLKCLVLLTPLSPRKVPNPHALAALMMAL